MFKNYFFLLFLQLFSCLAIAQNYSESNLLIDYESNNSTELQPMIQSVLQTLLENVPTSEEIAQIELVAFGEHRHIGEERMDVMISFLKQKGIDKDKFIIATQYFDKEQVQVIIKIKEKEMAVVTSASESINSTPKRYCAGASKKAQVFEILPNTNINLTGKEGTTLQLYRSDLVFENGGAVLGTIKVELKEFYKPEDILLADLHTMEGEAILETGGMLNLNMTSEGQPIVLREGRSAKIQLPAQFAKSTKGMDLYMGKPMEDGAIDWRLEKPEAKTVYEKERAEFNPKSYIALKTKIILDSITRQAAKTDDLATNNYPIHRSTIIKHTHEEEYFDLELPYIPTWLNVDKLLENTPSAPPPIEILVQVKGTPIKGFNREGAIIMDSPKVAIMLKNRSVFVRGEFLPAEGIDGMLKLKFRNIPQNEEIVLVAFLDAGSEVLFTSKELLPKGKQEMQLLEMKPMEKGQLEGALAELGK